MVLVVYALVSIATAAPICPPNRSVISAPSDVAMHMLKTSVYGNADRKTAKDFARDNSSTAKEVAKRFEASGDLECGNRGSQVQLVMKDNLVLVANHALPGSPCIDERALSGCKATFTSGGKPIEVGVKRMMSSGYRCKKGFVNKADEDWAILELEKPVPLIKPYAVETSPCASDSKRVDVVTVGKSADFGANPTKGWTGWTKHYANCQLRLGNCGQPFPAMQSDCDSSHGTSGGGMFIGGETPRLIGIVSGGKPGCGEPHPNDSGEYKEGCWSSVYAPIAGNLRLQLEELARSSAPSSTTPADHLGGKDYQDL